MILVKLTIRFDVHGTTDLDEHTDAVMDELLALENDSVSDSDVSAELANNVVDISVMAKGETFENAVAVADSTIRSAIHAAGGHTPKWEKVAFTPTATRSNRVSA